MVGIKEPINMEKRIELERLGRDPSKIIDLNLDNCKSTSIVGLSEEWEQLQKLSLSNVGLTTLKGFPKLSSLLKLELSDNLLERGLEALTCLPKLNYLSLSGNKINDFEVLKPLKEIKTLTHVELLQCKVRNTEDFREKMFALIPSLVFLDGYDKEDNSEYDEDDDDLDEEDEEDEDDEDEDEEDDEEDEEEEDVPLGAIYDKNFINNSCEGDDDYEAAEEEDEDEDIEEEEEEQPANDADADTEVRGKKRKLECED